ncbi:MAG TPA: ectonucleotide pyrophosphatase/phosphodiesterase [Terriglobia bacterium]|jgi:predicted AlkP superfamily pyrophosphatase or phosphodiesterase|nr:ectonucleotide pyrophosphatase/phosphodiesterase [Terriglobia bacterium]
MRKSALTLAAVLALLVAGVVIGLNTPGKASGRHVLVISVDGMGSSYYMNPPPGLAIPNIRRLMAQGSFAEAVEGVYPTLTYPAHTTIVTGRMPAEHGIYTNLSSREAGRNPDDWFWFAKAIRSTTLWDEARAHHLTTASVAWPVTAGAPIDWDVPEIWNPNKRPAPDPLYVAHFVRPLVTFEVVLALGLPRKNSEDDGNRTRVAADFLTRHHPSLTLVHLEALDAAQHNHGPGSDAAVSALERADFHIGELLAAVSRAGLENSTDVFIVSDHGFLPVQRELRPDLLLARAGLLAVDARGRVTGGKVTTVINEGSVFIYWPEGEDFTTQVESALQPLRDRGLIYAEFDRPALDRMGADPRARLAFEAADGAKFVANADGELVKTLTEPSGDHGYLPTRRGLESSFIACGPNIRTGIDLQRIALTEIAPTLLEALGIRDSQFGDRPPLESIFKTALAGSAAPAAGH